MENWYLLLLHGSMAVLITKS